MTRYYSIAALGFFFTTCIYFKSYKEEVILRASKEAEIEVLKKDKEHLRQYVRVAFRLDSVCNQFQSSRGLKRKLKITIKD